MARPRSPNRDKAFEIYKEHGGNIDLVKIAELLNLSPGSIRGWKNKDKWDDKLNGTFPKDTERSKCDKQSRGIQNQRIRSGNHNPKNQFTKRNKKAESHGFFSRIFPPETMEIVQDIMIKDTLDMLWENIIIQYTAIARSQRIMHVKNKEEMIKELKKTKGIAIGEDKDAKVLNTEIEYEFQFAWDRQATFLQAQSRAMAELRSMIKQYDEILYNNWDMDTEEQKLRIEKIRVEIEKTNRDNLDEDIEYVIKDGGEDENYND
ncbi:phage terminase small subunit [Clostridium sp. WILCCON 0269]|uniref:Phage terminase small subunit n=1 Tax=Candidatus Clostridium eludens TaxID=3381663 RepID=A0ABW8SQJ6_9CLOT